MELLFSCLGMAGFVVGIYMNYYDWHHNSLLNRGALNALKIEDNDGKPGTTISAADDDARGSVGSATATATGAGAGAGAVASPMHKSSPMPIDSQSQLHSRAHPPPSQVHSAYSPVYSPAPHLARSGGSDDAHGHVRSLSGAGMQSGAAGVAVAHSHHHREITERLRSRGSRDAGNPRVSYTA